MNKMVIYYSYTGKTKRLAESIAKKDGADLYEVKDLKRPGTVKAYTVGCFAAMRGKRTAIEPVRANLAAYDTITILAPVWASHPAPAINPVFDLLPPDKLVEVIMVSASGKSGARDTVQAQIESKGCTMANYTDMKG